jgi:hypothetical protein
MLLVSVFGWKISYFNSSWQPQIFLSFFYTLFLCALGLRYLPSISTKFSRNIALIGKASYHIFLVQIILFGAGLTITPLITKLGLKDHYSLVILGPLVLLGNIIIFVGIGVLFYLMEKKVLENFDQLCFFDYFFMFFSFFLFIFSIFPIFFVSVR